jgi:azurin
MKSNLSRLAPALLMTALLLVTTNARAGNPSPFEKATATPGRAITIDTAPVMQFVQKEIHVKAGESIALTLHNADTTMQHNWVLLKPGTTDEVGKLANDLASDPANLRRNYIPDSPDVICFTRVVDSTKSSTIYFTAPVDKGSYPYICTFPGHWMIMRGVLIVE